MTPKPGIRKTALTELVSHPSNPRQGDVGAIIQSIESNGWYGTLVAQISTGHVLVGNHRLQAAIHCGIDRVPVHWVDVDDDTAHRILLADNRTTDLATYDDHALADLLAEMGKNGNLEGTGYDGDDLDDLLAELDQSFQQPDDTDLPEPLAEVPRIAKPGDIWLLGNHRVMCGDSRNPDDVARLLNGQQINLAVTSPPYADRRKYDEDSPFQPIPPDQYVDWYQPIADNILHHLTDDGSYFMNIKAGSNGLSMETYVMDLVNAHYTRWGWNIATEYCWERNGVPMKPARRFKNGFEPVYQFTRPGEEWRFNPDAVTYESERVPQALGPGAGDTNWAKLQGSSNAERQGQPGFDFKIRSEPGLAYPSNRLPTFASSHEATGHGAAFPVGLPEFFIKAYTDDNDIVYDPFCGSGSTILAADANNRRGHGIEISPIYVDIICNRYQRHTDTKPILERTGKARNFVD